MKEYVVYAQRVQYAQIVVNAKNKAEAESKAQDKIFNGEAADYMDDTAEYKITDIKIM